MSDLHTREGAEIFLELAYRLVPIVGTVWVIPVRWLMFADGELHHTICVADNSLVLQKEVEPGQTSVPHTARTKIEQSVETLMRSIHLPPDWYSFNVSARLSKGGWNGERGGPFQASDALEPLALVNLLESWVGQDRAAGHYRLLDELAFLDKPWTSRLRGNTPGRGASHLPFLAYSEEVRKDVRANLEIRLYPRRKAVWEAIFSLGNYGRGYETNAVFTDHLPTLISFLRSCPIFGIADPTQPMPTGVTQS